MAIKSRYGQWGKHIELFEMWDSFNEDEVVREAFAEELDALEEGTGAPEGRADFPIFLQTVIRHTMRERFRTLATKWQNYVGDVSAQDFRQTTVSQLNGIRGLKPVNEDGEYPRMRTSEEGGPTYALGKHGGTYGVTMELIINDDADQILTRTPRELARTMSEYISQTVVAYIESNPTYTRDGQPFFGSARGNEVTGAGAQPNETNLMAIVDQMALRRTADDNLPFTVDPRRILTRTPSQKATFDRIIRSQTTGVQDAAVTSGQTGLGFGKFFTGTLNPAFNVLPTDAVVNDPWLNDPDDWYLFGDIEDRPAFVMAWLRGNKEPFIGLKDPGVRDALGAGKDPYGFYIDTIDYKIRHFFGVSGWEPLAALRARPA